MDTPTFTTMHIDTPITKDIDRIHVGVRVRPLNDRELTSGSTTAWQCNLPDRTISHTTIPNTQTCVDYLYDDASHNTDIYTAMAQPLVESTLNGINGTLFAYGQTSSGKTYTMSGLTRLAIDDIFTRQYTTDRQYTYTVSYIEIYNEKVKDLLNPKSSNMTIHEDILRGIFIGGLTEVDVQCGADVLALLQRGDESRQVGSTAMNEHSSRSHSIFRLHIASKPLNDSVSGGVRSATLQFIDLAGSERQTHTQASGQRLKEGGAINKSLLTLTTVIRKLSESAGKAGASAHVNYRDSKLTRILQPSLGGNSRTCIMCCITVSSHHTEETMSTLRFAARAKNVTNKIKVNEIVDERMLIKQLKKEVAMLRKQMHNADSASADTDSSSSNAGAKRQRLTLGGEHTRRESSMSNGSDVYVDTEAFAILQDRCAMYEQTIDELNDRIKELESAVDVVQLIEQRRTVEMERDDLREQLYECQLTVQALVNAQQTNEHDVADKATVQHRELQQQLTDALLLNDSLQQQLNTVQQQHDDLKQSYQHDQAAAEVELQSLTESYDAQLRQAELDKQAAVDAAIEASQREVQQIEAMISSIEQLMNERLISAQSDKAALEQQVRHLHQQVHGMGELQQMYDDSMCNITELAAQLNVVQQQHTDAVQRVHELTEQTEALQTDNADLTAQHAEQQKLYAGVQQQYIDAAEQLVGVNAQLAELQALNQNLCNQLDEIEDNAIEFNTSRTSLASNHVVEADVASSDVMCDIVESVEAEKEQLMTQKTELEQTVSALQRETAVLQSSLADKQTIIDTIAGEKYDVLSSMTGASRVHVGQQHQQLMQLNEYKQTVATLEQQMTELQAQIEMQTGAAQQATDMLQQQLAVGQQQLSDAQQHVIDVQTTSANTIDALARELSELQSSMQHMQHTGQQQLTDAQTAAEQLTTRCGDLQQQLTDMMTAQSHGANEQINTLTQQLMMTQEQLAAALTHVDELTKQVNEQNEQIDAAGQLLDDTNNDIAKLNSTVEILNRTVAEHLQTIQMLEQKAETAQSEQVTAAMTTIQALTAQLNTSKTELSVLQQQVDHLNTMMQQSAVESAVAIDELQQTNAGLNEQLNDAQTLITDSTEQVAALQSAVDTLTTSNTALQADSSALTQKLTELAAYTQSRAELVSVAEAVHSQNGLLTKHNDELLQQVNAMHDTIQALQDKLAMAGEPAVQVDTAQVEVMTLKLAELTQQLQGVQQQYADIQQQYTELQAAHTASTTTAVAESNELKSEVDKYKRRSELYSNKYTEIRAASKAQSDQVAQYKVQVGVHETTVADTVKRYEERLIGLKAQLDERDVTIRELEKNRPSEKMLMQLVKATRDVQKQAAAVADNKPVVHTIVPSVSIKPLQSISINAPIALNKPIALNSAAVKPVLSSGIQLNKPARSIVDKENHKQ